MMGGNIMMMGGNTIAGGNMLGRLGATGRPSAMPFTTSNAFNATTADFLKTSAFNNNGGMDFNMNPTLSASVRDDFGIDVIDNMLDTIGSRVRNAVNDRIQQWGPNFSLLRHFQSSDVDHRGYLPKKEFQRVLSNLGAPLGPDELAHIVAKFDKYGDSMVDYGEFCRVMLVDGKEFDGIMRRLASKALELRKHGVNVKGTFEASDMHGVGFVHADDFKDACKQLQLPITEVQLQTVMEYFACVGDPDQISYDEFLAYLAGVRVDATGHFTSTMSSPGMTVSFRETNEVFGPMGNFLQSRRLSGNDMMHTPMRTTKNFITTTRSPLPFRGDDLGFTTTRRAQNWLCPVCYFAENVAGSLICEMCSSANPSRRAMQIVQQCLNCSYENGESSRECEMCGEPLANRNKLRSVGGKSLRTGKLENTGMWRTLRDDGGDKGSKKEKFLSDSDSEIGATPSRTGGWRNTTRDAVAF